MTGYTDLSADHLCTVEEAREWANLFGSATRFGRMANTVIALADEIEALKVEIVKGNKVMAEAAERYGQEIGRLTARVEAENDKVCEQELAAKTWMDHANATVAAARVVEAERDALQARIDEVERENVELRRRARVVFEALDVDRSTAISKRIVRAILKGR